MHRVFKRVPLVLFFGAELLNHFMPEQVQQLPWNRTGLQSLLTCAAFGRCLLAAESLFKAEEFFHQAGRAVPFLRPMSVWINAEYAPRDTAVQEVLLHTRGRLRFEDCFARFLRLSLLPTSPLRVSALAPSVQLRFEELAHFSAILIMPYSPQLCMPRHLFRMAMPMFVPDRNLLRNMVHVFAFRFPWHEALRRSGLSLQGASHPFDTLEDVARPPSDRLGPPARAYWAGYSDYMLLPHLQRFSSGVRLLVALHDLGRDGLLQISAKMRLAYREDMQEMVSFWHAALPGLLERSARNTSRSRAALA